jgi:hypothetical protein
MGSAVLALPTGGICSLLNILLNYVRNNVTVFQRKDIARRDCSERYSGIMYLKNVTVERSECGPELGHLASVDPIDIQGRHACLVTERGGPQPTEKVVDDLGLILQDGVELVCIPDVECYTPTPQCHPLPFEFV